ncbi:MAG TPA: HAD-IA family hydrolase [Chloroflexota bacterium]|nr:HAD-IA family hydrolase [Chloroflexota bacterium]
MDIKERAPAIDAVLFDLDGTLLDTTEAIISSLKHTVHEFTGRTPELSELRPYMGLPLADTFACLTPGRVQEACDCYVEHNLAVHKDLVRAYPGVNCTIEALRRCGIKRGLVTSKRRRTAQLGLEIAGLAGAFDAMVFYGDTEKSKPDPEPVMLALKLLGLDTAEGRVIFVGDSPWDVRAARNASPLGPGLVIMAAAVTYGATAAEVLKKENPDYLLDSITQILPLCGCPSET